MKKIVDTVVKELEAKAEELYQENKLSYSQISKFEEVMEIIKQN